MAAKYLDDYETEILFKTISRMANTINDLAHHLGVETTGLSTCAEKLEDIATRYEPLDD